MLLARLLLTHTALEFPLKPSLRYSGGFLSVATTGPESKMVCTREAYLAREASGGSPMPGAVCACAAAGRAGACLTSGAGRGCRCLWLETRSLYATPRVGSLSQYRQCLRGLKVCASVARCVPACRSMHRVGVSGLPLALSLAVRSLAGCTADRAADDRSFSACLCGL